jgi:hypothetical protein
MNRMRYVLTGEACYMRELMAIGAARSRLKPKADAEKRK